MEVNGNNGESSTQEALRSLLDPLDKSQLIDLLSRLGSQNPSIAEEIKRTAHSDREHRKLFVHGLAWNTTSETLCSAFAMHGEIEEGAVIYDKATGKSRGYGFITYKHTESAKRALRTPCKLIDGCMAVYKLACERASTTLDVAQRKLFIGGLSPTVTPTMLTDYFARHGQIAQCSILYHKRTHASRGFGFVTYETAEAAKAAMDDPEKILEGSNITVKLAVPHKGKAVETQLPSAAVVPPMAPGYPLTVASYPSQPPNPYANNNPQGVPPTGRVRKQHGRLQRKPTWPY